MGVRLIRRYQSGDAGQDIIRGIGSFTFSTSMISYGVYGGFEYRPVNCST